MDIVLSIVIRVVLSCQVLGFTARHDVSLGGVLLGLDATDPTTVGAVLLLVEHDLDLLVGGHALIVGLVVVLGKALNDQLLAVPVSTDLVLVCALVVSEHLVYLGNDFAAVHLVVVAATLLQGLAILSPHDVAHRLLLLVDLHYLRLLLQGRVGG